MSQLDTVPTGLFGGTHHLARNWGWVLAAGVIMILLGMFALGATFFVTLATVLLFGWLLIISGVFEVVQAFQVRQWGGFFIALLMGILDLVVGALIVMNVGESALLLTLLLAVLFFVGGVFGMVASVAVRPPNWGWGFVSGLASLILGVLIWRQWPYSGAWVIGLFVGIQLIFRGWAYVMLSMALKSIRPSGGAPATTPPAAPA